MSNLSKFEQMLEHLVNEDKKGAEELFHEIVVEKSRKIYESLLEDEDEEFDGDPTDDLESDIEVDSDLDDEELGDMGDEESDEFGEEESDEFGEEGEEDIEDRVVDLEDALDDLKAEFERMMSDESDMDDDSEELDFDMEGEEGEDETEYEEDSDDFEPDMDSEEEPDELKDDIQTMREYVEKVSNPKPGDNGQNTASVVANSGFNTPTAKPDNIAQSTVAKGTGKTAPKAKENSAGNVNTTKRTQAGRLKNAPKAKMGDNVKASDALPKNRSRK